MNDTIELLSTNLLDRYNILIDECNQLSRFIGVSTGWHYPLDWAWIINQIGNIENKRVIDAGAGRGVLQWYLAEHGATVYSVDRDSRACLPFHIRRRYLVKGLRPIDLISPFQMFSPFGSFPPYKEKIKGLALSARDFYHTKLPGNAKGKVIIYNKDLLNLTDIESNSIDFIVSVSALEHNPPNTLPKVINELERVLKPGGFMAVTMSASKDKDWYHEPSKGWCYTEQTFRRIFNLPDGTVSNFYQYDQLFKGIKENTLLRHQLAKTYFRNNKNGLPGGVWDPKYHPVGIIKIKKLL